MYQRQKYVRYKRKSNRPAECVQALTAKCGSPDCPRPCHARGPPRVSSMRALNSSACMSPAAADTMRRYVLTCLLAQGERFD